MILITLSEVIWDFYNRGRPKATAQTYSKEQIAMFVKMAVSNMMRRIYFANQKLNEGEEYYDTSPLLSTQRFDLPPADMNGKRRADMSQFDLFRLPKNTHIINAYPIGCGLSEGKSISMVKPGEEFFYLKPKFKSFRFGVPKGRGIDTYNLPPCVKFLDVESTFDSNDVDVSLDIAYDVGNQVLGVMLQVPGFIATTPDNPYALPRQQLRTRLNQTQAQTQPQDA